MNKEEYIERYRIKSKMTNKEMERFLEICVAERCDCDESMCDGWAMVRRKDKREGL